MAIIQKRYAHLNQADSGSLHRKLDATEAYVTGSLTAASTLHVVGTSQLDGQAKFGDATSVLAMAGGFGLTNVDIAVEGDSVVGGQLVVSGNLTSAGNGDFMGTLSVGSSSALSGAVVMSNTLDVAGAAILHGTLEVKAAADMYDVLPNADLTYDLGSTSKRWAELHAGTAAFTNLEVDYLDVAVTASVAQLTGSAGAKFTAGDVLVQAGQVSASSDLKAGGALVVAGNADLNGQLDVAAAATFQSTLSASGNAQLGGTLEVAGNADLNGQLDVALAATFQSTLSASGAGTFAGSLNVNGAGQALVVANSASIGGDLTIIGDLVVQGEQVVLDTVTLQVEDKNIEIAKVASPTDITADGAGITIKGASDHTLLWYNDRSGGVDAFSVNDNWLPEADLTYDLGKSNYRWNKLFVGSADLGSLAVSGEATFGAGIAVTGTGSFTQGVSAQTLSASQGVSGGSLSTDGSLTVQGAADLNGGLDVIGAVSASAAIQGASFAADGLADFGSLQVAGAADLNGGLDVVGAISASAGVTAASFTADGLGDFGSLDVSGNATLASLTASVGAEIQGPLSASELTVGGNAVFNGTATFNGTFAVPGEGNFGSLVVGGVNLSPISSSNPVSTVNDASTTMLTQILVSGDMAKYEIEVIARGGSNAAAWKISVAAMNNGEALQAAATELSKEFFGSLGAQLDVDVSTSIAAGVGTIDIIAKGVASAGTVYWDCQIVKKMVLDSANGARKY